MTATIISSIFAFLSAAFVAVWGTVTYKIQKKDQKKDEEEQDRALIKTALKGILHQEIIEYGDRYVEAGEISRAEYDDFQTYLYDPYIALDGDGTAKATRDTLRALLQQSGGAK